MGVLGLEHIQFDSETENTTVIMEFNEYKAIYLPDSRIVIFERILNGKWNAEKPRTSLLCKELGEGNIGASINTVSPEDLRYDLLQQREIIYNKRGIGYFVAPGARQEIIKTLKDRFLKEELPVFFKRMDMLSITLNEIENYYKQDSK